MKQGGIGMGLGYVPRGLAPRIASAPAAVVVLEGAPGVGKTALVKNELAFRDFHYVTLADKDVFAQVRARPKQWASSLPRPVVIDDVQRAPGLLGTIRRLAPKKAESPAFVLLTSQPLPGEKSNAPKPARFTLFPLTQAEIDGRKGNVVDDLFGDVVYPRFHSPCTRGDLRTMMRIGGFPYRVTHPVSALAAQEGGLPFQERLGMVGEQGFEAQLSIEGLIEKAIIEKVLLESGLSVGLDAVGRMCGVNAATLDEHLQRYWDEFLIHRLTMLDKPQPQDPVFARTRIHPIDTALAVEALRRRGHDVSVEIPTFARMLRTFCVNQLVPAAQWASEPTECHHWKKQEKRVREVDLVLSRGERIIGITIRNSLAAYPETIGALRCLTDDERFARGFIIYMGRVPRQLSEKIWAIPVSALWDRRAFLEGAVEEAADKVARRAALKAKRAIEEAAKASLEEAVSGGAKGGTDENAEEGASAAAEAREGAARASATTTVTATVTTSATIEAVVMNQL